jgi:uncharacterized protein
MSNNSELRRRKVEDLRGKQERRSFDGHIELREAGTSKLAFLGWPCVTDTPYEIGDPDYGGFIEEVASGAFRRSLQNTPDVILNIQHGAALSGLPIARTRSGTLRLSEDEHGLRAEAPDLDLDDPDVQALRIKFSRGDLDGQMSFAFRVPPGGDRWSDDLRRRTIMTVELAGGDCSIVTFGANPATSSELLARARASAPRVAAPSYSTQRERERLMVAGFGSRARPAVGRTVRAGELDLQRLGDAERRRVARLMGRS